MSEINYANHPLILGFPESEQLAQNVADRVGLTYRQVILHRFPDGESYIRLPDDLPEHVIFFRSMSEANNKLIELLLAAKTARKNGVRRLSLMAPYLCYMRQDNLFNSGEALSQQIIGELLADNFDDLFTVDPHLHRTPTLSEAMPVKNTYTLTASTLISDFLKNTLPEPPLILGPDAESEQWARQIAAPENLDYAVALKTRFGDRDVNVDVPDIDIRGRIVVIIDDISSSGQTLIQAALKIKDNGAKHIYAAVTHALMDETTMLDLQNAGIESIWSSDTIAHSTNVIGIEPVLTDAIKHFLD